MKANSDGLDEQGPSGMPFINDPAKPTTPPLNADATDAAEAEDDIQADGEPFRQEEKGNG